MKDGGAAFPRTMDGELSCGSNGMTLRDWFAGQALANSNICNTSTPAHRTDHARNAYAVADALIVERQKQKTQ